MSSFLIDIGFFTISIWDILDIVITGLLIFTVYRVLRGSLAFPVFIGIIIIYILYWVVQLLNMSLLSMIFGQFVSVGVIVVIIIFQPEVRRFLLLLGNTTMKRWGGGVIQTLFNKTVKDEDERGKRKEVMAIKSAIMRMSAQRTGALIVFVHELSLQNFASMGVKLDSEISQSILLSIFFKNSPLHDGAVIIHNSRIHSASCILPVSDNRNLPQSVGLRHRSAVGSTEGTNATAFVVSEETGKISYARSGQLIRDMSEEELYEALIRYY